MTDTIEFGIDTFGDVTLDAAGQPLPQAEVLRHVVEEAVLADRLGVGSAETVARKIATTIRVLDLARFDLKYSNGALPHDSLMTSVELYATRVALLVRELLDGPGNPT